MMNMRSRSHNKTNGAFSLVEVLVAMLILLIGVLSIARIFPGGFLSIQRTGDQTAGKTLAEESRAAMESLAELPQGIYAVYRDVNGNILPDTRPLPDEILDYSVGNLPAGIPNDADPYYYSNINRTRFVKGESVRLPIGTPNSVTGGYGAIYPLQLGPVYNEFGTDGAGNRTSTVKVYGTPFERAIQSSLPTPDQPDTTPLIRNETQYAIDYDNRKIAFFPRIGTGRRVFLVKYAYNVVDSGSGKVVSKTVLNGQYTINDLPAAEADNAKPTWHSFFTDVSDSQIVGVVLPADFDGTLGLRHNSDEISRQFRLITKDGGGNEHLTFADTGSLPAWSNDPYEYAWYSPQYANSANAGILVFNPSARSTSVNTASGSQPLVARADYLIFDNHILREDRTIPNRAPFEIKLSISNVLTQGDVLNDQTRYNGMFRDSANDTPSVALINTATGELLEPFIGACTDGIGNGRGYTLNARNGTIRFNDDYVVAHNLQLANIRVYYRAAKEFGVQIQKAYTNYNVTLDVTELLPSSNNEGGFCFAGTGSVGGATRIYFPRSEAGKSVTIGDYHVATNLAGAGRLKRFNSEVYRITADASAFEPTLGLPYIDLRDQHPEAVSEAWSLSSEETGAGVGNVQGMSLKSRVLWLDSATSSKDTLGNTVILKRWRHVDSDTLISKVSSR